MSETAFERAYLRRPYTRRISDMSWKEFAFYLVLGFSVLVFATLITFGPFPAPSHAHAMAVASTTPMTDEQIAHQLDKEACAGISSGNGTVGGHISEARDYCNKFAK